MAVGRGGGGATSMLPLKCLNAVNKMSSIEVRCHWSLCSMGGGSLGGVGGGRVSQRFSTKGSLPGSAAAGDVELLKQTVQARSPL